MKHLICYCFTLLCVHFTFAQSTYFTGTGTFDPYTIDEKNKISILSAPSNNILSAWQTIPFSFTFYGATVTGYYASDNGYITFDNTATTSISANDTVPLVGAPNNAIYAFWDDLELMSGTSTLDEILTWTFGTAPNRTHVIQWHSVSKMGGSTSDLIYFAILLFECGGFDIVHNWKSLPNLGLSATIGCENSLGTLGTYVTGSPALNFPPLLVENTDDVVYHFYDTLAPQYEASIVKLLLPYYADTSTSVAVQGILWNRGSKTITSVGMTYLHNGDSTSNIVPVFMPPGNGVNFNHGVPLTLTDTGVIPIKVWITAVNSIPDEVGCNDILSGNIIGIGVPDSSLFFNRIALIEEVTQWNSFPCASQNPDFNLILSNSSGKVAPIAYHGWWPDPDDDAFYQFNKTDNKARIDYYEIDGVPTALLNGKLIEGISYVGAPSNLTEQMIDNLYAKAAIFSIDINETVSGITANITVTIEALIDITFPDMTVYIVITEEKGSYTPPAGINNETDFPYVMRFMLPNSQGLPLGKMLTGQKTVFMESYVIDLNFNPKGMRTLVFIQEDNSKEVLQAAKASSDPGFSNISKQVAGNDYGITIWPTLTTDEIWIEWKIESSESSEIILFNMLGQQVATLWTGNSSGRVEQLYSDVSSFPDGVYLVVLSTTNARHVKRFTKISSW